MRAGLDSNILVYLSEVAMGPDDTTKIATIRSMLRILQERATIVIPTQALGELFVVLRRGGVGAPEAREFVLHFSRSYTVVGTGTATFSAALDLAVDHRLQFWDSLILSAAAEAGCDLLLSEDMQDGFVFRGMTIANPFSSRLVPELSAVLER